MIGGVREIAFCDDRRFVRTVVVSAIALNYLREGKSIASKSVGSAGW
jgi:hypothetical protein